MNAYERALIIGASIAIASPVYAAAGEATTPPPKPEAVKPAEPPATPSGAPAGFPVLVVPAAIVVGAAVALGTDGEDADFSTATSTTGTTGTGP